MEVDTKPFDIEPKPCTSSTRTASKLDLCEVCAVQDAKYTCPKCEVKTCCLKCSKIHKLEIECDGQRDRTKFIPLNKFTNLDMSSDYRLLEEVTRNIDALKKEFGKKWNNFPVHLLKLRAAAKSRRTTVKFLPYKFTRRRNNTSWLNVKTDTIYWYIEWVFVNADNLKFCDTRVSETEKLSFVLSKYFIKQSDENLQETLQYYQAAGIPGIKLFLKAEQKRGKKFYELDPSLTLKECLEKKLIIEYPTVHVVLKDHGFGYDVIDSDDEDDMRVKAKIKSGNEIVKNIVTNAQKDESLHNPLKNLLFASEYSGEELSSDDEK